MANEIGITKVSFDVNRLLKKHAPDNIINSVYEFTSANTHIGYDKWKRAGGKNSAATWDCSELSARTIQNMTKKMDECDIDFKTNLKQLQKAFPNHSTTVGQRAMLDSMGVPKVSGKSNVMKDLEVGMLIYMRYPTKNGQMGHVATVSRDPSNGDLVISESNGSAGVTHRSLNSFFNSGVGAKASTNWVRYDPFYKDRSILKAMEKEADQFVDVYKQAETSYRKEVHSPFRKVGAKQPSRDSYLNDYLEKNFEQTDYTGKSVKLNVASQKYQLEHRDGVTPLDKPQQVALASALNTGLLKNHGLTLAQLINSHNPNANEVKTPEVNVQALQIAQQVMKQNNNGLDEDMQEHLKHVQRRSLGIST